MTLIALTLLFNTYTKQFDLPPNLLASLCYVESTYKVNAIHHDDGGEDSLGVCQIKLSTAKWLGFKGTQKQLMDPKTNIHYAAKMLNHQRKRYHGNITKAVIAYNIGHAGRLTNTAYSAKVFKELKHHSRGINEQSDNLLQRKRTNNF